MEYPILYKWNEDQELKPYIILDKAYDIKIKDEILSRTNGYETLEFSIPFDYDKRQYIKNEMVIEVCDRLYTVKYIDDTKSSQNTSSIQCDALWYELGDGELKTHEGIGQFSATAAIQEQLDGTGWSVGVVEVTTPHQFTISEAGTSLYNLRYIQSVFGGDMWFDTKNKRVNLYEDIGEKTNNVFSYNKNTEKIQRTLDTRDIITRYKLTGMDNITIGPINNNIDYVENYSYYDNNNIPRKIKVYEETDERFSNMQYMKYYMEQFLEKYSKPVPTYNISVAVLREIPGMGDYIYVIDSDLELKTWLRVVAREIDPINVYNSKVTLENVQKDITSVLSTDTSTVVTGESSSAADISEASIFNLLLNSRGDDGVLYWENDGFEVDDTYGRSGYCSFKCDLKQPKKSMTQTIYPNTCDYYAVSAMIDVSDDYEYQEGDKIGIEVEIEYEDGSIQTEFIDFFGTSTE